MNNQFDEKTEDAFKRIFSADSIEFRNVPIEPPRGHGIMQRSLDEAIKHGTSFVKFENGSIINLDRSQVIKGE